MTAKYRAIFWMSVMDRLAYGFDLLTRCGMLLLFMLIFANLWEKVAGSAAMAGLNYNQVIWYLLLTESMMLALPQLGRKIDQEVKTGAFSNWLIRPCDYLKLHASIYAGEMASGLFINMLVGAPFVYFLVGPPPISFSVLPMIFLSVILGLLLNFCMTASIALLSFWVEDNEPFFWIYNKFQLILGGVLIPLDFFPDWLSSVALQLPFMQIFYGPARLFVSFSGERALQLILGQSIWLVLAFLTLRTLFFFGVRQVNTNGG